MSGGRMKAARLHQFGQPLVLEEVPIPVPGPGEVLVRVRACGVCYTDVKITRGRVAPHRLPALPHIPGHEPAGEVVALGAGVKRVREGERVAVYHYLPCLECFYCRRGQDTLCERLRGQLGFSVDGAYAEYLRVPEEMVEPLAPHVPFEVGAVITDAVATALHAVRDRADLRLGESVVVIGAGAVGLHAIQVAKMMGGRVLAVDREPSKLELARNFGAHLVLNSFSDPVAEIVREHTHGRGADVVVEAVGSRQTIGLALSCLRPGGRLALVGYARDVDVTVPSADMISRQITVLGNRACTLRAFRDAVAMVNREQLRPVVTERVPLECVNEVLDALEKGNVRGRTVLEIS